MPRYLPFIIWFFIAFGLIAVGTGMFLTDRAFVARSLPVVGEVTGVSKAWVNSEQRWTAAVVWRDAGSRAHEYAVSSSSAGTYVEGQRIALRYDPVVPSDVRADGLPFGAITVGGIGVAFLGVGIAVVVAGLRRERARALSPP